MGPSHTFSPRSDNPPWLLPFVRVLVWVYGLSWIGDFRGTEQGGSAFQFLTFAVTVGTAFLLMFLGARSLFRKPLGWLILMWGIFLASTFVVAVINGISMNIFIRGISSWLLVFTSMCVCQVASGFGLHWREALFPMLISSAGNVILRAFYALKIAGIDPERVRVEMLSQSLPLLMALMVCGILLSRKLPVWPMTLGALGLTSYIFSITRSAVFVIGAAGLGAVLALIKSTRMKITPPGFKAAKIRHIMSGAGGIALTLILLGVVAPFVYERWIERLTHPVGSDYSTIDPSTLTRLAENKVFLRILQEHPVNFLFGMGIGGEYWWDESFAPELSYTYGNVDIFRSEYRSITFPGHTIWTYSIFSGGFFGLAVHMAFFTMVVRNAWRAGCTLHRTPHIPLEIGWLAFAGALAFLSASFTFNPFIERSAGIVLGFLAGFPQFIFREAARAPR